VPDTIAAIATGGTVSAIGIVRISGDDALTAADNIFQARCGLKSGDFKDRQMYYGELINESGELLDLCLCMVSRGPGSYTGEDTVEFHCHGSPVVLLETMRLLRRFCVRPALAGEFTKRAFLNGRMDLVQAEAVIDLIEAENPAVAKNAAGQLTGAVSIKMKSVYDRLIDIMAHFHAVIDYPDEDIDEFSLEKYLSQISALENELCLMLETYERGKVLRDGIPTAIIGRTNTGKSSLLNALLGYDRAIVTDIAGTTRDTIEEKILINNVSLRLIDTAGFRDTQDIPEMLGVERTVSALKSARLVLLVLDGSVPLGGEDYNILKLIPADVTRIAVVNKSDLPAVIDYDEVDSLGVEYCFISALSGEGIALLIEKVCEHFREFDTSPAGELITNARQAYALSVAVNSLSRVSVALSDGVTPDAIVTDIESALIAIGEITGTTIREDVVSRIFERFCVGK